MNLSSRKTIMLIVAIFVAILGFLKEEFALVGDPAAAISAIGIALIYIFFEAKADLKRIKELSIQTGKWKDPKFWIALIGVIIAPINEQLGLEIPVAVIQSFAAVILPILFAWIFKPKPSSE